MAKVTESNHRDYPSIYRKIRVSLGIMVLLMFSLFWTAIYLAENQMEVISLHHWLDTEANRYAREYTLVGDQASIPNKAEFSTYWSKHTTPDWLHSYQVSGFYEHLLGAEDKHFIVRAHPSGDGLMYLVFQDDADDYLDEYESTLHYYSFFIGGGISVLMVLYGVYVVRSLSQPLSSLEGKINKMPPDQPLFEVDTTYAETRHIEQTLIDAKTHISGFFQREKDFSQFASHELRTPIMVIRGSADLLEKVKNLPPVASKAIKRIQQESEQMQVLTETFLMLGKETFDLDKCSECKLEFVLMTQLEKLAPVLKRQEVNYTLVVDSKAVIHAPESFITIVVNNLIKNAFSYSTGDIDILLNDTALEITNGHDENDMHNEGYGCGLVIVQRICERMGWQCSIQNNGAEFRVILNFMR